MSQDAYDLYRRGLDAIAQGRADEAITPLQRACALEAQSNSILEALGQAYLATGFFDRAAEQFQCIVDRDPVDAYAHFCLGRSLDRLARAKDARRHYRLAVWFDPQRRIYRDTLNAFLARTTQLDEIHDLDDDAHGPMVFGE